MIVEVLSYYYPEWPVPKPTSREWVKAHCPFHGDETASASVSFERDAFRCHACGVRGDALSIIAKQEGVSYKETDTIAALILGRSDGPVPPEPVRKSGRRLFGTARAVPEQPRGREVPARVRRRVFGRA